MKKASPMAGSRKYFPLSVFIYENAAHCLTWTAQFSILDWFRIKAPCLLLANRWFYWVLPDPLMTLRPECREIRMNFTAFFSVSLYKQLIDGKDITFIATNDWEWQSARTKPSVRFSAIGIWGIHRLYSIAFLLTSASLMREKRRPSYMDFAASFSLIQYKNT